MLLNKVMKTAALAGALAITAGVRPATAETINGAGATFPYPIYSKWFQAYHNAHPGTTINYQAVGSGAGIAQYKAGTVDFGASDAPLSDAELAQMPQPTIHIPTVAGAVVLAYNIPGVGPGLRLSGDIIADIYLGKIKSWDDARIKKENPSINLPATAITVVHRADGSGTSFIFTNYLSAVSGAWKGEVGAGKTVKWPQGIGGNGNPGVAALVKHSPGGIGYIELAYAIENHLSYGPVRNKAGNYVNASIATTTAAAEAAAPRMRKDVRVVIVNGPGVNTYPIAGFTYLLVSKAPRNAAKARELLDLVRWAMGPGQQMAGQLYYAPLPRDVVAINEKSLSQVRLAGR